MPQLQLSQPVLIIPVDDELYLGLLPNLQPLSTLGTSPAKIKASLKTMAEQLLKTMPVHNIWQFTCPGHHAVHLQPLVLEPPSQSSPVRLWSEPLNLDVPLLTTEVGHLSAFAHLALWGDETVATSLPELQKILPEWIQVALRRHNLAHSLAQLSLLERLGTPMLETLTLELELPDLRTAASQEQAADAPEPMLPQATFSVEELVGGHPSCFEADADLDRLQQALLAEPRRSLLLVGPAGVGKTARMVALASQKERHTLGRNIRFTSGARLIAGTSGTGDWQGKCQQLIQEASRAGVILHMGGLVELTEVGKADGYEQSLAQYFLPSLLRGTIQCVFEVTPEELGQLERSQPRLIAALELHRIEQPSQAQAGRILVGEAERMAEEVGIMPEALALIERLVRRYGVYSVWPGRPLRLLRSLQRQHMGDLITVPAVLENFSRETGLPLFLIDERRAFDRAYWREWLLKRVLGQVEPVEAVLDVISTLKAGLNRPKRPLASLLFVGPTGVGKTQLARSLAELIFQSPDRLLRFDMSEFSHPLAVQRLVGGFGQPEGLLTSKVREQPFSVLLFDEVEKADASFFDLLLQVLGEGRLTDALGRQADFTNTIVVMTSNLGVSTFQTASVGFGSAGALEQRAAQHFTREVEKAVRPELFNRLDRILSFAPLSRVQLQALVERELAQLLTREGLRSRNIRLHYTPEVVELLVERGFDPRYGARPLKRSVEQWCLTAIALELERQGGQVGGCLHLSILNGEVSARFQQPKQDDSKVAQAAELVHLGHSVYFNRMQQQRLIHCEGVNELRREREELRRISARKRQRRHETWLTPEQLRAHQLRIQQLSEQLQAFQTLLDDFLDLELKLLLIERGLEPSPVESLQSHFEGLCRRQRGQLNTLLAMTFQPLETGLLVLRGETPALDLFRPLLEKLLVKLGLKVESHPLFQLPKSTPADKRKPTPLPQALVIHTPVGKEPILATHPAPHSLTTSWKVVGCILSVSGERAAAQLSILEGEWQLYQQQGNLRMSTKWESAKLEKLELTPDQRMPRRGSAANRFVIDEPNQRLSKDGYIVPLYRTWGAGELKELFDALWEQCVLNLLEK